MIAAIVLPAVVVIALVAGDQRPAPMPPGSEPPPASEPLPQVDPVAEEMPEVTFDLQEVEFREAMSLIAMLAGTPISIADNVSDAPPVTLKAENMRLDAALDSITMLADVHWRHEGDGIVVSREAGAPIVSGAPAVSDESR